MEEGDVQDIIEFAKKRSWIDAVYVGKKPESQIKEGDDPNTVYFYIPGYRWSKDKESQAEIDELDHNLGLEMGMRAIWRSPEDAEKDGKLEKIIYQKEKK